MCQQIDLPSNGGRSYDELTDDERAQQLQAVLGQLRTVMQGAIDTARARIAAGNDPTPIEVTLWHETPGVEPVLIRLVVTSVNPGRFGIKYNVFQRRGGRVASIVHLAIDPFAGLMRDLGSKPFQTAYLGQGDSSGFFAAS